MSHRPGRDTGFEGVEEDGSYLAEGGFLLAVGSQRTSGLDLKASARRGLHSVAEAASGLGKKFKMDKSLAEHLDGLADSMSGVMDYLVDGKRMLFRTEGMVQVMDGLLGDVRSAIDGHLAYGGAAALKPVDMSALRAYVNELVNSEDFAAKFYYQAGKGWELNDDYAEGIAEQMSDLLGVDIDGDLLKGHLQNIVNCAVEGMETVTIDAKDRLKLFFDEKYHGAALALAETKSNLAARASYAKTYVAEKAKVAGTYVTKAGTMLNQYLLQPALRTIQNLISTAFLAAASLVGVALAGVVAGVELGGVGTKGEKFKGTKAMFEGLQKAWEQRLDQVREHIATLKTERDSALFRDDQRIKLASGHATTTIGMASQTRDTAITKAGTKRADDRALLSGRIDEERTALGKAKAQKKVGQRTATALREMGRVDRKDHGTVPVESSLRSHSPKTVSTLYPVRLPSPKTPVPLSPQTPSSPGGPQRG
jgi:hypothetical protein